MTTTTLKTIDSALFLSAPNDWVKVVEAMKPGAHLLLINPVKEHHIHTIRAEDSGLEVRDTIAYVFADGENDVEMMLVMVARKPLEGTVAENTLRYGTGGINVDKCRIGLQPEEDVEKLNKRSGRTRGFGSASVYGEGTTGPGTDLSKGRWPSNLIHSNSYNVLCLFPTTHGAGNTKNSYDDPSREYLTNSVYRGKFNKIVSNPNYHGNSGGNTARFFHSAPTLNNLIEYLLKLITPPGGTILTSPQDFDLLVEAAKAEGFIVLKQDD